MCAEYNGRTKQHSIMHRIQCRVNTLVLFSSSPPYQISIGKMARYTHHFPDLKELKTGKWHKVYTGYAKWDEHFESRIIQELQGHQG